MRSSAELSSHGRHPQGFRHSALRWALGLSAVVFGVMTLLSGGNVLFGGAEAHADAGDVVSFVLLFNFSAGFLYVTAGIAALLRSRWALRLARLLAATNLLIFGALGVHIAGGGAFETRTVVAMTLRSLFWIGQDLALGYIGNNVVADVSGAQSSRQP